MVRLKCIKTEISPTAHTHKIDHKIEISLHFTPHFEWNWNQNEKKNYERCIIKKQITTGVLLWTLIAEYVVSILDVHLFL